MDRRDVLPVARIDPDDFTIYNFPGSMEVAALFRPHVRISRGLIREFDLPDNDVFCDMSANMVFFIGREPNLKWQRFADCLFAVAERVGVKRILFMGSFGGSVPHTREPRLYGSVSQPKLRKLLKQYGLRASDYEGPGSFASFLLHEAPKHDIEMLSLVAEIPSYLQGTNPLSIEAIARRLAAILGQPIDLDAMRETSNDWESRVTAAVEKDEELADTIRKLEEAYDNELIEAEGA
jgi:proteasome assembly chaperone (PAC2) family protein